MPGGYYIVIEGGEGCGKSTQSKSLVSFLNEKGIKTIRTREPGTSIISEEIRGLLLNTHNDLTSLTELFLFEAARMEFFRRDVLPNLRKGVSIVSDRSGYSTEAYQGYAGGVDLELIRKLNKLATFETHPDLLLIIDIEASKGLSKEEEGDRFAAKGIGYHERVNQGYREIAKRNKDISIVIPYIENQEKQMQEQIRSFTQERLGI